MASHDDIAWSWAEYHAGKRETFSHAKGNLYAETDALYSYGRHFPLAIPLRNTDGTLRAFLLNGDNYSVTTSRHQSITRNAVSRTGVENVVIPFSALQSAGIVRSSIRIVEARDAWYTATESMCSAPHALRGYGYVRDDEVTDSETYDRGYPHGVAAYPHRVRAVYARTWDQEANAYRECACPGNRVHVTFQHHLGASVFLADVTERNGAQTVTRTNVRFLSAFDEQEARPCYFLAELPAESYAESYKAALEDLRPAEVKRADRMGVDVSRQGDMFAIPRPEITTKNLRELGATFTKRGQLFGTVHTATEVATLADGTTYGRGMFRHEPRAFGERREPDHSRRRIGDGKAWHVIVPNTVPRGNGRTESATPRAWTVGGRVD